MIHGPVRNNRNTSRKSTLLHGPDSNEEGSPTSSHTVAYASDYCRSVRSAVALNRQLAMLVHDRSYFGIRCVLRDIIGEAFLSTVRLQNRFNSHWYIYLSVVARKQILKTKTLASACRRAMSRASRTYGWCGATTE